MDAGDSSEDEGTEASEDEGTEASEDEGTEVVMDESVGCRGLRFLLSAAEETELGFSAEEAAEVITSYESVLVWIPASGPVQYLGGEPASGLTVAMSSAAGEAYYFRSLDCKEASCPTTCISQIQLPVEVMFTTESGEFSERLAGRLGSWELGEGSFRHEISPGETSGTLSAEDFAVDAGWTTRGYDLEFELNNGASRGRFLVRAEFTDGSLLDGALAVWPPPG